MSKCRSYLMFILVVAVIAFGVVTVVYSIADHDKYVKEINSAINGCVQCKFQELDRYYFYTCDGIEYGISRQQWVNLNVSECK